MQMQPSPQGGGSATATASPTTSPETARSGTQQEGSIETAIDTLQNVYQEVYGFAFKGVSVPWNTLLEQLQAAIADLQTHVKWDQGRQQGST